MDIAYQLLRNQCTTMDKQLYQCPTEHYQQVAKEVTRRRMPPEIRKASSLNPEAKPFSPNKILHRPFLPHDQLRTVPSRACRPLLVYYQPQWINLPYLRPQAQPQPRQAPVPPPPPTSDDHALMMLRGRGSAAGGTNTRGVVDSGSSPRTKKKKQQQVLLWKPKAKGDGSYINNSSSSDVPTASVTSGGADSHDDELRGSTFTFTTLMIRNIPNSMIRKDLIEILDKHCRTENQKIMMMGRFGSCCRSEYDLVYLPIDYWSKANKGYAFVNFTSADGAKRMWKAYHRLKWEDHQYHRYLANKSHKVCEICPASVQGKDELQCSLGKRAFPREEYQPLVAEASPRDGFNNASLVPVGSVQRSSYRHNQASKGY